MFGSDLQRKLPPRIRKFATRFLRHLRGVTLLSTPTMSKEKSTEGTKNLKRKRTTGDNKRGKKKRASATQQTKPNGPPKSADELAWKKISLENDEFDDFEEIEGVDIEYVEKDGSKVIQFKVVCWLFVQGG
jgi:hypothetical protein